ncbi:hypothetical protein I4U23_025694 [Adineta vaga]|nr:hypothetical protein I4U23_025694 [Adineta vaga]
MESTFGQLVSSLDTHNLSIDTVQQLNLILRQQTDQSLASFIRQSYEPLFILERWMWKLLSDDNHHRWIDQSSIVELFYALASFNKNLIFLYDTIDADAKATLLFSVSIDEINSIFKQINNSDNENDTFIAIAALWFDNHAYFIQDNPLSNPLPITHHLNQYILHNYIVSKQYQNYLKQISQVDLLQSIFTAKMLFYVKTCSFSVFSFIGVGAHKFPYTAVDLISQIKQEFLQIVHIHSKTVAFWSKELLSCMTQLISFAVGLCWWDGENYADLKIICATEEIVCDYIQDLIRIIDHKPFHKLIKPVRFNDETSLIDAILTMLMFIVKTQDINWFFRSNVSIQNTLLILAETSPFEETSLSVYGILGKALTEEQISDLKVCDAIGGFFFNMLEKAWRHTLKKYKQVSIEHLLQGFLALSKHDFIQQRTADLNKVPLFIEISDEYPLIFDIIWGLSFNRDIQLQLLSNSTFIEKLTHLSKQSDDEQIRKATTGILWNLQINQQHHPTTDDISPKDTFDFMISYSHKDKVLCKQLYDELIRRNYRVWIDFDQMHGNVMDAMAQAIDRSQTIIICMSEQYRKSNFCRAEAHYAFQQQRQIVPVLMQKHYKPDGWLLFLIGQLLYVDFTKYDFDRAMEMLMKELKEIQYVEIDLKPVCQKEKTVSILCKSAVCLRVSSTQPSALQNILEWTHMHVHNWLIDHKLPQMSRLLIDCDGRSLLYLNKYMKYGESNQTLKSLQEECMCRIDETLSLIELSRLQALIDEQKRFARSLKSMKSRKSGENSDV